MLKENIECRNDFVFQNITRSEKRERELNRKPTEAEKEKMEKDLNRLLNVFEKAPMSWSLEGGAAVSMLKGYFTRQHKDWDIEIEAKDLPILETYLKEKGYGLFLIHLNLPGEKTSVVERMPAGQALMKRKDGLGTILAMPVRESGQIIRENDGFEFHIIERDTQTNAPVNNGVILPEKWFTPKEVAFNGRKINVGQPAKLIYYKINLGRSYDVPDMVHLAESGFVSLADIEEVEQIIEQNKQKNEKIIAQLAQRISLVAQGKQIDEIETIIKNDPVIAGQPEKIKQAEKLIKALVQAIANDPIKSKETILKDVKQHYDTSSVYQNQFEKLATLKQAIKQPPQP